MTSRIAHPTDLVAVGSKEWCIDQKSAIACQFVDLVDEALRTLLQNNRIYCFVFGAHFLSLARPPSVGNRGFRRYLQIMNVCEVSLLERIELVPSTKKRVLPSGACASHLCSGVMPSFESGR